MGWIAGGFKRVEPRRRVRRLMLGLLSDLPRKSCWTIAAWAEDTTPDGMQHLLGRAKWDADSESTSNLGAVDQSASGDSASSPQSTRGLSSSGLAPAVLDTSRR